MSYNYVMNTFLKFWLLYLPLPLYFGMYFLINSKGFESARVMTVFIVPVIYGYLIPYVSTTIMKKWEFLKGPKVGGIYLHQGFKIASHLVLWLYLLVSVKEGNTYSVSEVVILSFFGGTTQALIVWIHDILAIKYGFLKMNNVAFLSGVPAESLTFRFAPMTFFTLGFLYTLTSLIILNGYTILNLAVTGCIAFLIITMLVSLVYKYCESYLETY